MKTAFLSLILALFLVGTVPSQASAQYQMHGYVAPSANAVPAAVELDGRSITDMSTEQLIAVGVGALVGMTAADMLLGGGMIISIVGLVAGALAGNAYYLEGLWPFN